MKTLCFFVKHFWQKVVIEAKIQEKYKRLEFCFFGSRGQFYQCSIIPEKIWFEFFWLTEIYGILLEVSVSRFLSNDIIAGCYGATETFWKRYINLIPIIPENFFLQLSHEFRYNISKRCVVEVTAAGLEPETT